MHVYLVAAYDAKDSATVKHADFIDLGTIKGNIGDQNYSLGTDLDIDTRLQPDAELPLDLLDSKLQRVVQFSSNSMLVTIT